jgi:hypothetical protein
MCGAADVCSVVAERLQLCCSASAGALALRDDCCERAWPGGVATELLHELHNLFLLPTVSVCTLALVKQVSRVSICTLALVKQVK